MLALKKTDQENIILYQKYKMEHPRLVKEVLKETEERKVKADRIPKFIKALSGINKKIAIGICAAVGILFLSILTAPTIKRTMEQNISKNVNENVIPVQGEIAEIKQELENVKGIAAETKEDVNTVTEVLNKKESNVKVTAGKNGKPGLPGKDGIAGASGVPGVPGAAGINGKNGAVGASGAAGAPGAAGMNGKDGVAGASGAAGEQGQAGIKGKDGVAGEQGQAGMDGEDGVAGKDGIDGINGVNGKSAYAVAVEAGYTGTDAEYAKFMADTPNKIVTLEGGVGILETGVNDLNNALTGTNQRVEECFRSVSDGKTLVAAAITDKGIATAAIDDFPVMEANIRKLADAQYNTGFIDGQKNAIENLDITYTKHFHEGSSSGGGGCYTKKTVHNHSGTEMCGWGCYTTCPTVWLTHYPDLKDGAQDWGCLTCNWHWYTMTNGRGDPPHYEHFSKIPRCGYQQGQILSYSVGCGYTEGQILTATITY